MRRVVTWMGGWIERQSGGGGGDCGGVHWGSFDFVKLIPLISLPRTL